MKRNLFLLLCAFVLHTAALHAATFKGKVTRPDGAPVANAELWAGPLGLSKYEEADGTLRHVKTDVAGAFVAELADAPTTKQIAMARVIAPGLGIRDVVLRDGENAIRLQAATGARGIVQDTRGLPVAGAVVQAALAIDRTDFVSGDIIQGPDFLMGIMAWNSAIPAQETRSDDAGKWQFPQFNTGIFTLADPRFATDTAYLEKSEQSQKLTARPGATVSGTILDPDGKPLPGVFIWSNEITTPARTDAQGRFTINRLPLDRGNLMGVVPGGEFMLPPLQVPTPLKTGEVNVAREWKASRGVEITGIIVDKNTGAPVANAKINSMTDKPQSTNAQGRFRLRTMPTMSFVMVFHEKYMPLQKNFPASTESPHDVGKIEITRAVDIKGVVRDENGAPLPKIPLVFTGPQEGNMMESRPAETGADGTFQVQTGLGAGTIRVSNEEWELTPKTEVKMEIKDGMAPLTLTVRRVPMQEITSRVVDTEKRGVAGVSVFVMVTVKTNPDNETMTSKEVETDKEGKFTVRLPEKFSDVRVTKVQAPGYRLRKAGKGQNVAALGKENVTAFIPKDKWQLDETVLAALTATVKGRVLNANAQPVAGALVSSPEGISVEPVKTDETGNFVLKELPEGETLVLAAHGDEFARGTVKNGEIEMRLQTKSVFVTPMRRQVFEQLSKVWFGSLEAYWKFVGTKGMLTFALQKDGALSPGEMDMEGADWTKAGSSVYQMFSAALRRDPAWLRQNGMDLLAKIPPDAKSDERQNAEGHIVTALAFGSAEERAIAQSWLDKAAKIKDKPNDANGNATRWFRLAGIAGALGDPRAKNFALSALTLAASISQKNIADNDNRWGSLLGMGGPELFDVLEGEWRIEWRLDALVGAVDRIAPLNLAWAREFAARLKTLEDDPETKKARAQPGNGAYREEALYQRAQQAIATAQIALDPAAALEEAEKRPGYDGNLRNRIALTAWRKGDTALAGRALNRILEQEWASVGMAAQGAVLAERFDKELAAKLWEKAAQFKKRNEEANFRDDYRDFSNIADYAFFRAAIDPAHSRLQVEAAWQDVLALTPERRDNSWSHWQLSSAMMPLDPVRAVEMVGALSDNVRNEARARIAAYLMSPESERALLQPEY